MNTDMAKWFEQNSEQIIKKNITQYKTGSSAVTNIALKKRSVTIMTMLDNNFHISNF